MIRVGLAELKVFSGSAHPELAKEITDTLGIPLGQARLRRFPDTEVSFQIDENIRGTDVFVVQPTCTPVDEHLVEMLIMIDAFRRSSAARITAVLPYYGYGRQDRKDKPRVPISAKLVANLLSAAGANRVLTMDLHKAQIQGFFDIPVDHLFAAPVLNDHFVDQGLTKEDFIVVSPDEGSIKRALGHVKRLGGGLAIVDKRRTAADKTSQENIIGGPVEGKIVLMFDDMISTAGSICGAAEVLAQRGAKEIHVAATHGVLCGKAPERLTAAPITSLAVTDTIPLTPAQMIPKIRVLSVSKLLGEGIKRIHRNESVSRLFN